MTKRLEWILNGGAIVAFVLGLVCCALPNLQIILDLTILNVIFAPLYLLIGIHIAGIYWLISLLSGALYILTETQDYSSLNNGFTWVVIVCMVLWLIVIWVWVGYSVFARKTSRWRSKRSRWLAPLLLGLLSMVWISHIPLSLTFAYHKPALEQLANQVMATSSKRQEFMPPLKIGVFDVPKAFRESQTIAAIIIDSNWAVEGFIRDLSRKPGGLDNTYGLTSGSIGKDELFYLGDGWYMLQNLFD